jgi:hypothetical protein
VARLVDMRRSPEATIPIANEVPDIPWGLRMRLEAPDLKKLKLDEEPEVGDEIKVEALARITSVSKHETEDHKECCIELSVIKMRCIDTDEEPDDDEDD